MKLHRSILLVTLLLSLTITADARSYETRRGQVFSYPVPTGWSAHDSSNGVEVFSPDGSRGAYAAVLMRQPGHVSAEDMVAFTLRTEGYRNIRIVTVNQWIGEAGFRYCGVNFFATYRGTRVEGRVMAGTKTEWGQSSADVRGFHTSSWRAEAEALQTLLANIKVADTRHFAGQDTVWLPGNNPLDETYGAYQSSSARREAARNKSSKDWQAAMLGRERMKDPQTGRIYNMPVERYDGTVNGYRNPTPGRHNEVLVPAAPGE